MCVQENFQLATLYGFITGNTLDGNYRKDDDMTTLAILKYSIFWNNHKDNCNGIQHVQNIIHTTSSPTSAAASGEDNFLYLY
jgi:hypothetical protein